MPQKTYHLWRIGCQMNEADALRAAALLENAGYRPAPHPDSADFHLLSTCVVRQQAEDKVHARLRQLAGIKKYRKNLTVAILGCFVGRTPAQHAAVLAQYPFVTLLLPPSDLSPLAAFLAAHTNPPPPQPPPTLPSIAAGSITAHLPIILGCSHACTYCVIPYRRGPERSRPSPLILQEAQRLVHAGVREITLLGQIVDRYGLDRPGEILLPELLRRVAAIPGLLRVRFLTSHPAWISPDLIQTVATTPKLCPHFEIPVQAGANPILAAMRRGYTAADYRALLAQIRSAIPHAGISTDIIVGFPGETPAQFDETMTLMRDTAPDMIRIAKYSPRPQTWSARHLPDNVPPQEKERRRLALDSLLRQILAKKHAALLGQTVELLVESIETSPGKRHNRRRARTPNHKLVFIENTHAPPGALLRARITWTGPYSLLATPI